MSKNSNQNQTRQQTPPVDPVAPVEKSAEDNGMTVNLAQPESEGTQQAAQGSNNESTDTAGKSDTPPAAEVKVTAPAPEQKQEVEKQVPLAPEPKEEVLEVAEAADPVQPQRFSSIATQVAVDELTHYVANMERKQVLSAAQGGVIQSSLYRALLGVVKAPEADFEQVFSYALSVIHESVQRNGAFHATNAYRYLAAMTLPEAEVESFRKLLTMFLRLAAPKGRHLAARQIDFDDALRSKHLNEQHRQRVIGFVPAG